MMSGEQPTIVINMQDYPSLRDAKAIRLQRLQAEHFQLVIRKFDQNTGKPTSPDVLPINRDGAKAFADGLAKENERLRARIASNEQAIEHLTKTLIADMDTLDAQALKDNDL